MAYKNKEDKLNYTRNWWKEHPLEYAIHKKNCANNNRIKRFLKNLKDNTQTEFVCIVGVLEHKEKIDSRDLFRVVHNCKLSHTPLRVILNESEYKVIER